MKLQAFLLGLILFLLTALSAFVGATWSNRAPTPPPVEASALPVTGTEAARLPALSVVEGIPIVRLRGTPREMGLQHGRLLRDQIHFLRRYYLEDMVMRTVGRAALRRWAREVEPFIPKHYLEEIGGVAEGAGLSYRDMLAVNVMVDRFQTIACSTFVAGGKATRGGEVLLGRNLDFPGRGVLHRMTVVFVFEPDDGVPLVSVGWPGMIGVLSGMNGHGVCGATMMIHSSESARPGIPYMLLYREALARARTADEVHAILEAAPRTCPNNFMAVDPTGAAFVTEFTADKAFRRGIERDTLCSTNFFHTAAASAQSRPVGEDRYDILRDFLQREHGQIDLQGVLEQLAATGTPWYLNVQAMVFLPRKREIYLSVGGRLPAARQRFVRLDSSVLLGPGSGE